MSERKRPDLPARPAGPPLPEEDPEQRPFLPDTLDRTVIAIPLLKKLKQLKAEDPDEKELVHVIIDLNLEYPGGRSQARERARTLVQEAVRRCKGDPAREGVDQKSQVSDQYLFGQLSGPAIRELVRLDTGEPSWVPRGVKRASVARRSIYRIWEDFEIRALIGRSVSTVKADAARAAFAAMGEGIVWGVMDSGIDAAHPHFDKYATSRSCSPTPREP